MASVGFYKYVSEASYETQSLYLDNGSATMTAEELRSLGTKRILFLCDAKYQNYRIISEFKKKYEEEGFRLFSYTRREKHLTLTDIRGGIRVFNEFNCDTVVAIGGCSEIDCGKYIAALAANYGRSAEDFDGINNIRRDMTVLCCVMTDNSYAASSAFAEYYDDTERKWHTAFSSYLIPQIAVIDMDVSMRTDMKESASSSMLSLGLAFESYASPYSSFSPEYKANALDSCLGIISNIDKMRNNPGDTYLRRMNSIGGFYAGLASRMTGFGYGKLLMNALFEKYHTADGGLYLRIIAAMIETMPKLYGECAAELSHKAHLCTNGTSNEQAGDVFVNYLRMTVRRHSPDSVCPSVDDQTVEKIASDVKKEAAVYGLEKASVQDLSNVLRCLGADV